MAKVMRLKLAAALTEEGLSGGASTKIWRGGGPPKTVLRQDVKWRVLGCFTASRARGKQWNERGAGR
jgi:hypothetical protein